MTIDKNNLSLKEELHRLTAELETKNQELKLEASLETVRNVALALQKSDDMLEIARVLYEQLLLLGFTEIRNAIIDLHNDDDETFLDYDYSHDMSGTVTLMRYDDDPIIEKQFKAIVASTDAFFELVLEGQDLQDLIDMRLENGEEEDPRLRKIDQLTYNLYSFGNGAIGISNFGELTDDQKRILKRFRNVFTFAYKRYSDLAQAEARARASQIEIALERVRSRTMGMEQSNELGDVANLLFKELNSLVDNLWICGFVLCEENSTEDEWWISNRNGFVPAFKLENVSDPAHHNLRKAWEDDKDFHTEILEGEKLNKHYDWLMKGESTKRIYEKWIASGIALPTWQKLHGAYFKKGYLIIITQVPCPEESIFQRFALAFDLTYTRFLDLQLKEKQSLELLAEKQLLESTLANLQATQNQLIHSEKMASLGALTAGIAHEIQNPLNFVNNYAEVSIELIEEMDMEIKKGDFEEANFIADSIKSNLEKINHHGKRADGIVRGMLQHSRKSTSEKEFADINKLADEYLRLAYHGLRAKDKSFNATLVTEFDESLDKIKVFPQDLGRVILNLITNAFYACNDRKKTAKDVEYKPTVTVKTERTSGPAGSTKEYLQISVQDNANGIPQEVIDKIFQPFFTTKPTGEGTGLGLSMSYDIIKKGHDGDLLVVTKDGIGSTFTIQIPINP